MLGTPPAFILSQDQTLVKSVCLGQKSLLAILSLFTVWFVFKPFLKIFLFKEIFKGCCLLFSYQGSFFVLSQATAFIFYHKLFCLSRTFLNIFYFLFSSFLSTSQLINNTILFYLCQLFFYNFFKVFFRFFYSLRYYIQCSPCIAIYDI